MRSSDSMPRRAGVAPGAPLASPGPGRYDRSLSSAERRADQRRRLLLAATEVFASEGYAGASVEAICSRVSMSRRTFYEHFDDLRAVLLDVHDASARVAMRLVSQAISAEKDPLDQVRAGISAFLTLVAANGSLARVLFREVRAAGPQYEKRRESLEDKFAKLVSTSLAAAHAAGALRLPPDETTVFAIVAAIEAVGMRHVERGIEARLVEAVPALHKLAISAFL